MQKRIATFIEDPAGDDFEAVALAAFRFQFERIEVYRRLCTGRGLSPESINRWQDIPMVPTQAFKSVALHASSPIEVFRSSGTTQGSQRSTHHHPFPDLYRQVIEASFPAFCLPDGNRRPMLSLIPSRQLVPDSSLSFMIDHVLERFGGPGSLAAVGKRGVEAAKTRSWLAAQQRKGQPVLVLATALSLHQCLQTLARMDLRFRLPAGSAIFETGGFKTQEHEIDRDKLLEDALRFLNVPGAAVVREYGMTELTSQAYTRTLTGGDSDIFVCPPWMRARILDPETLRERAAGEEGMIAFLDLANVGSALHVLSEDMGARDGEGFRLLGRATGAELRGCSLTAEELIPGSAGG